MAERKLPKDMETPPEIRSSFAEKMIVETREYKLITPLFGGGVEPNTPDPVTVIRATEIRGHLRFWWRATRGGQFETIEELKAKEDEIWGSAAKFEKQRRAYGPSPVSIRVLEYSWKSKADSKAFEIVDKKNDGKWRAYPKSGVAPAYASFPLKPDDKEIRRTKQNTEIPDIYHDVEFTISISYPNKYKLDIEAALWAWETFGGIGARTRRGFGAISNKNKLVITDVASYLRDCIDKFVLPSTNNYGVPYLSKDFNTDYRIIFDKDHNGNNIAFNNPKKPWDRLINKLQQFRQQRDDPSPSAPYTPGRSRWPEPDSIRLETGCSAPYHNPRFRINKYPRAAFGLPIVTKFNDKDVKNGDPQQVVLQGVDKINRLASPLFLRPFAFKTETGNKIYYVGLAFILNTLEQPPGGVTLEINKQKRIVNSRPLTNEDINELVEAGLVLPNNNPNILEAFLDYLEQ
jgi:CRISPR type III-B/RAMP module RAMP protein Cmr1